MTETAPAEQLPGQPPLKRVLGSKLLLFFVVGDIVGTGVYALTGQVAGRVGGALWLPFLLAFVVAFMTAFSYLELVGKYPRAAGAALYTHKAFNVRILTFLVAFAVMCSGITSASSAAVAFGDTYLAEFITSPMPLMAILFIALLGVINFRGVRESVTTNVVLTCIEIGGLLIIIGVGAWAVLNGAGEPSRLVEFNTQDQTMLVAITSATSLAFFSMVGFEDSVNMAEETKDPTRTFPKIMLSGLMLTGIIYVLVSLVAVAVVPVGELTAAGATPLLLVVQQGAPNLPFGAIFPFISMFAVANTALINMLMASRLLYGMAKQRVLPPWFGWVLPGRRTPWFSIVFTTGLAVALITFVGTVSQLGGTTALLLLGVFTLTNVAVLVLRKDKVAHDHFRAPTALPIVAAVCTFYLVGPWTGRPLVQFSIAGILLAIGAALGVLTYFVNKRVYGRKTEITDVHALNEGAGPFN